LPRPPPKLPLGPASHPRKDPYALAKPRKSKKKDKPLKVKIGPYGFRKIGNDSKRERYDVKEEFFPDRAKRRFDAVNILLSVFILCLIGGFVYSYAPALAWASRIKLGEGYLAYIPFLFVLS